MIKVTYCLRRKPGMSWEEFSRYWREEHGPLVASKAEVLGIRRYVQVRTVDSPELHTMLQRRNDGSPEPFDGIAEIWLDDVETFQHPAGEEARKAARALLEDERRFIDMSASPMWVGEEWEVVPQ